MRHIDRYILLAVIKAVLMTLLAIAVLSYVLTFMDEVGDAGKGDYRIGDVMLVVASRLPRFLYDAFSVSALIGVLLAMGSLAANGELVAMRAAGMSVRQLIWTVFKAGLLVMVLVVLVGDVVGPPLERWGQQMRLEKMNKQVTFRSRYGFWIKDQEAIVNIRQATPEGELKGVSIYELGPEHDLERITVAARGDYEAGRWVLRGVRQSELQKDRVISRRMARLDWESVVDPEMLSVALIRPDLIPAWELYAHVQALKAGGQRGTDYAIAFWNKLSTPLTTLAMLLLAVPLVTSSPRHVHAGQWVLTGGLIGAIYYLLSKGFAYGVVVFDLPPVSVLLFPVAGFAMLLVLLLQWRQT